MPGASLALPAPPPLSLSLSLSLSLFLYGGRPLVRCAVGVSPVPCGRSFSVLFGVFLCAAPPALHSCPSPVLPPPPRAGTRFVSGTSRIFTRDLLIISSRISRISIISLQCIEMRYPGPHHRKSPTTHAIRRSRQAAARGVISAKQTATRCSSETTLHSQTVTPRKPPRRASCAATIANASIRKVLVGLSRLVLCDREIFEVVHEDLQGHVVRVENLRAATSHV